MASTSENIERVRERIEKACYSVSRRPDEVLIVAVTKTVSAATVQEAVDAGIRLLGENRIQEAASKIASVNGDITWHMVGHLQRNKVKKAVTMFEMIQSVDSYALALEINRRSEEADKRMEVLVEVNTSREQTKYGVAPEEAVDLIGQMSDLRNISVKGLMTIGALTDDEGRVRDCFRTLRELAREIETASIPNVEMQILSMGMTSDYELAIEEGSNMVRIGTAIFGARQG